MERIEKIVDAGLEGLRLDRYLASVHTGISRSEIQRAIRSGHVRIGERVVHHPSHRLRAGSTITWEIPARPLLRPQSIPLHILYEDEHLVAVDKPAGLVVHPGAGTDEPTLVEGLLVDRSLPVDDEPIRPGIAHRLDKETSGALVVAKTPAALTSLKRQFAARTVMKFYVALVQGTIAEEEGEIDAPVGRDPARPCRMTVHAHGRPARTQFRVLRRTSEHTLLLVRPHTGRTHQIRVHLRYIAHPVLGDTMYGGTVAPRLFLHAWRLVVRHPLTKAEIRLEAPLPADFPEYPYDDIPWDLSAARQ